MKKYIIITGDYNDGDYVTKKSVITDEQINIMRDIVNKVEKIKLYGGGYAGCFEWKTGDQQEEPFLLAHPELTEDEIELVEEFRPSGEYGIHTIEDIEILTVLEEEKLL